MHPFLVRLLLCTAAVFCSFLASQSSSVQVHALPIRPKLKSSKTAPVTRADFISDIDEYALKRSPSSEEEPRPASSSKSHPSRTGGFWDGLHYRRGMTLGFSVDDIAVALPCLARTYILLYTSHNPQLQNVVESYLLGVFTPDRLAQSYYDVLHASFEESQYVRFSVLEKLESCGLPIHPAIVSLMRPRESGSSLSMSRSMPASMSAPSFTLMSALSRTSIADGHIDEADDVDVDDDDADDQIFDYLSPDTSENDETSFPFPSACPSLTPSSSSSSVESGMQSPFSPSGLGADTVRASLLPAPMVAALRLSSGDHDVKKDVTDSIGPLQAVAEPHLP